jgi:hypothetical protein
MTTTTLYTENLTVPGPLKVDLNWAFTRAGDGNRTGIASSNERYALLIVDPETGTEATGVSAGARSFVLDEYSRRATSTNASDFASHDQFLREAGGVLQYFQNDTAQLRTLSFEDVCPR